MDYVEFTKDMKKDYTILVPNMLPMHFKLIVQVLRTFGYKTELLTTSGHQIADTGLKYCHNDACYPAILVIGQFIDALQNGGYDPNKTALIMFQTGGGCRASNYIFLIRKALEKAGYGNVPVISLNLIGLEKHSGFKITVPILRRMIYGIIYGDLLMTLVNQVRPYEIEKGTAALLAEEYTRKIAESMHAEGVSYRGIRKTCRQILKDFAAIPVARTQKVKVGVVGEIYIKYSPLGNNNLNDFLVSEGAEVSMPGLLDFMMSSSYCHIMDYKMYGMRRIEYPIQKLALKYMLKKQRDLIKLIEEEGTFQAPTPFLHTVSLIEGYIGIGAEMGEGWLLPAEMLELYDSGVKNIVCAQPFGCLPNHIVGKGMMKPLKEKNPGMNIVAIDYDAGATVVNQENRLKLMLANARGALEEGDAGGNGMKIALVSDIHGNAVALEAVVLRAEEERVDAFAFLGDYVCDFPNPQRVLEIVRRLQTRYPMWLIRGNREEYLIGHRDGKSDWWGTGTAGGSLLFTYQRLDQSDLALFDRMPFQMEIALDGHRPFSICHASPFQAREWMIRDDARIRACLDYIPTDFLFCGHAHEIRAFRYGGKQAHFVGSCGIPIGFGGMAQYAVIDDDHGDWEIRHVMIPYDLEKALAEFEHSGLSAMGGCWTRAVMVCARTGYNAPDELARRATAYARDAGVVFPPIPEECYLRAAREIGLVS